MDTMTLAKAADGTANLHIWREGEEYLLQKGHSFLKQWNNLVFAALPGPPLANTRYVDLSTDPLGFADETFDAVYSYHVFEHLTPFHGRRCAQQIIRALKPGGIFRVSVPDLETACRDYLDTLRAASDHSTRQNLVRYRWAVMAIFEQMVRERSGGLMLEAIEQGEYDDAQLRHLFGDALRPVVESRGSARPRARGRAVHPASANLSRGADNPRQIATEGHKPVGSAPDEGSSAVDVRPALAAVAARRGWFPGYPTNGSRLFEHSGVVGIRLRPVEQW